MKASKTEIDKSLSQEEGLHNARIPEQFDIMVTTACNAHCAFCVQEATYRPVGKSDDLFISGLKRDFKSFYELGGRRVVITGGEPTLVFSRVIKVLDILSGYNDLEVNAMYTNGSRLLSVADGAGSATVAESLAKAGLGCINLSVHHYKEDVNKRIFGLDHKPPTTEEIARHLHECGLPFRFNLTLQKDGIASYADFVRYVEWAFELGATDIYVRELFHFGFDAPLCKSDRDPIQFASSHLAEAKYLIDAMNKNSKVFALAEEHAELCRDKREYVFEYLPDGKKVYIARLTIGTEDSREIPYLIFMPNGYLYRGWLGDADELLSLSGSKERQGMPVLQAANSAVG